jgi:hypothetical protein
MGGSVTERRACDFGFCMAREQSRTPRHAWQAWRLEMRPEARAQIGSWLLECPFAHPVWSQWVLSLVHLRALEGLPVAVGSGHSLAIFAVDPCYELGPEAGVTPRSLMSPPVVVDFATFGANDVRAVERVEALIEATMRRELSPDDDYQRRWEIRLRLPSSD